METPKRIPINKQEQNIVSQFSTPVKIPSTPLLKHLGYGTAVNVYRLDRSPRFGKTQSPWAVKKLRKDYVSDHKEIYNERIRTEAEVLRNLNHPNIIGFRAVKKTDDGRETLVMEACHTCLGTILEERFEEQLGSLPALQVLKMASDISIALEYLHETARILHGDIKSHNILVKGNFETFKLCDFGVCLKLDENGCLDQSKPDSQQYIGTELWSAPEVITGADVICDKADIFSFGLVIYETIALIPPHTWNMGLEESLHSSNKSESEDSFELSAIDVYEPILGTRPPLPEGFEISDDYNKAIEIFVICTNELPEDRPSAKNLAAALKNC